MLAILCRKCRISNMINSMVLEYRKLKRVLVIVATVIALSWLSIECYAFLQVDICLDSGGAYDYEAEKCIHE